VRTSKDFNFSRLQHLTSAISHLGSAEVRTQSLTCPQRQCVSNLPTLSLLCYSHPSCAFHQAHLFWYPSPRTVTILLEQTRWPRTRAGYTNQKGRSRGCRLDNTRRVYQFVLSKLFPPSESADSFTYHSVIMERRNTLTSLAPGLRPLVRSQPTPLTSGPAPGSLNHIPFYDRFLQSWPHMHVQARSCQDRNMLASP
jgi:hypothetical protein